MIRKIIACDIVPPMATTTSKSSKKRKSVSLQVCIDELQLILSLSDESKNDPRLPTLVADARADILDALSKINKGDDTSKNQNPDRN
jgi:hypothetical protein